MQAGLPIVPLSIVGSRHVMRKGQLTTRPGHGIEFTIEQLAYKKTYTGTGSLTTQPLPNAPIGTRNTLVARDTTTGEVLEQHGIWYDMSGGGGGLSLWAMLKKLLWKG